MAIKETAWNRPNLWRIRTYRWQRPWAATNIDSTDWSLPAQGWSKQIDSITRRNLSHRYFCPGQVKEGLVLAWIKHAPFPSDGRNARLLTKQYSHSVLLWPCLNSYFLVSRLPVFLGMPPHWWLSAWRFPGQTTPSCLSQFTVTDTVLLFRDIERFLRQMQHWSVLGHTAEAQLFHSAHSMP